VISAGACFTAGAGDGTSEDFAAVDSTGLTSVAESGFAGTEIIGFESTTTVAAGLALNGFPVCDANLGIRGEVTRADLAIVGPNFGGGPSRIWISGSDETSRAGFGGTEARDSLRDEYCARFFCGGSPSGPRASGFVVEVVAAALLPADADDISTVFRLKSDGDAAPVIVLEEAVGVCEEVDEESVCFRLSCGISGLEPVLVSPEDVAEESAVVGTSCFSKGCRISGLNPEGRDVELPGSFAVADALGGGTLGWFGFTGSGCEVETGVGVIGVGRCAVAFGTGAGVGVGVEVSRGICGVGRRGSNVCRFG